MKTITCFMLLFIINQIIYSENEIITQKFNSPNNKNIIIYHGVEYRGDGSYYIVENGIEKLIVNTHIQYGPQIKWINDDIAEIFLPYGSPFYHSYYYSFSKNKLSALYDFPFCVEPIKEYVAIVDIGKIIIYEIFTGKIIKEFIIEGIDPCELIVFCDYKIEFKNDYLYFTYKINKKDIKDNKWIEYKYKIN